MSLDKILSIGGKPGLFKLLTQTRAGFVAESLLDGKKITVSFKNNVSVLSEIAIYTLDEEVPLREVFLKIQEKENGEKTPVSHKDDKLKLEEYFFEVLPNYDEDRVYASDIKKVIQWYNMLLEQGITDFSEKEEEKKTEEVEEKEVISQEKTKKSTPKKAATKK
tara:strand:+ start:101056 stop:101547 length:492 start_codon:yes stop_codon:yes gene_type:complete